MCECLCQQASLPCPLCLHVPRCPGPHCPVSAVSWDPFQEIDGFFRRYDTDGGGEISFDELVDRVCSAGHGSGGGATGLAPPWDAYTEFDARAQEEQRARIAAGQA